MVSDTSANVTITADPTAPAGSRDVTATRNGGASAACAGCLTVVGVTPPPPAGPTIAAVTPASVSPGFLGGVELRGTGLSGVTSAAVAGPGVTVKSVTVLSPSKVRLRVAVDPAAPAGPRLVTVTTSDGQQATATLTIA